MSYKKSSDFVDVVGLWRNERGTLSGKARGEVTIPEGAMVFLFENKKRAGKRDPDMRIVYLPPSPDGEPPPSRASNGEPPRPAQAPAKAPSQGQEGNDDIPW